MPDYFREPPKKSGWSSLTATLLAAACLLVAGVVVLKMLGQLEPGSPVGDWLISVHVLAPQHDLAKNSAKVSSGGSEPGEPGPAKPRPGTTEPENQPADGSSGSHGKASASEPAPPSTTSRPQRLAARPRRVPLSRLQVAPKTLPEPAAKTPPGPGQSGDRTARGP